MTSTRLKKFFTRYNTFQNGKLSLHEFLDIFIPQKLDPKYFKPASETLVQRVKEWKQIDHFVTLDTLFQIRDFIFLHLRVDKAIERALFEISKIPSFELLGDLKVSGVDPQQKIEFKGLRNILKCQGISARDRDLEMVARRLVSQGICTYMQLTGNLGKL